MPYIELKTNGKIKDREALKRDFGRDIAEIPGKSERWLMISVEDGCDMCFARSGKPCAVLSVSIFGGADDGDYERLTQRLTEDVSGATGISPDRIYIKYAEADHWGWNGGNF